MSYGPQPAPRTAAPAPTVPTRWTDALSTLLGALGPTCRQDVQDALDHVVTGRPAVPPRLTGAAAGTAPAAVAARRVVLSGLADVPVDVALRWVRLNAVTRPPAPATMTPLLGGAIEALLDDLADTFDAPARRVPLDLVVLEDLVAAVGLPPAAVLLAALRPAPGAAADPSRACLTLTAMRGYDEALVRHTRLLRATVPGLDPAAQRRSVRMLGRASTRTLRVLAELVEAMAAAPDADVRAVAGSLRHRMDAARQSGHAEADDTSVLVGVLGAVPWQTLGRRLSG